MKKITLLAALLLALLVAAVGAQPATTDTKPATTPADTKPATPTVDPKLEQQRLEKLVEQLGDADFRKRDLAADQIKTEGLKALPVLRASLKHPDPEIRRRLVDLIPTIETAAVLAPKRITLKMKDKTLNEIFADFTKQTDYKFEFYHNQPDSKFTVDVNNLTYWEAMDQITKATGMDLQQGYGDDRVRLQQNGNGNGGGGAYTCTEGAFRFMATGFQLYKHVDLSQANRGANRSESLTFMFVIQSEPKLPILGVGEAKLTAAFDSEKNSMLIASNPNEYNEWDGRRGYRISRYGNGSRMWYQQTQVQLNRVSEKATSVKVVRGTLPVTLLSEQKPHVIAEKIMTAKGKKEVIGTTTINVEEVTAVANTAQYQVKVTFTEDTGGNPNDYSWQNAIYQRLEVVDAKGNKYQLYGTSWGNSNGTSLQMTLTYGPQNQQNPNPKADPDVKLIFQEWKIMQHQVHFEFKDLPLP